MITIVVIAYPNVVQRQMGTQHLIDRLHDFSPLSASSHIRLVGHGDEQEARLAQRTASLNRARQDLQLSRTGRGIGLALPHQGTIQYTVPIEKNSLAHGMGRMGNGSRRMKIGLSIFRLPLSTFQIHRTDSHFMGDTCKAGWETSRCQTRAWKDSVWGVTVSWLTGGMTTQASATWAV